MADRAATASISPSSSVSGSRKQLLTLEVPISVEALPPSADAPPPFSEQSRTAVVFADGAVAQLAANAPSGLCVKVTNLRSKEAVLCRVVGSKHNPGGKPFVEFAFLKPVPGFWGVVFPEAPASPSRTASIARTVPPEHPQPQKVVPVQAKLEPTKSAPPQPFAAAPKVPIVPMSEVPPAPVPSETPSKGKMVMLPLADDVEGRRSEPAKVYGGIPLSVLSQQAGPSEVPADEARLPVVLPNSAPVALDALTQDHTLPEVPVHVREVTLLTQEAPAKRSMWPLAAGIGLLAVASVAGVFVWKNVIASDNALNEPAVGAPAAQNWQSPASPGTTGAADQTVAVTPSQPPASIEPVQVASSTSLSPGSAPALPSNSSVGSPPTAPSSSHAASERAAEKGPAKTNEIAKAGASAEPAEAPRKQLGAIKSSGPVLRKAEAGQHDSSSDAALTSLNPPTETPSALSGLMGAPQPPKAVPVPPTSSAAPALKPGGNIVLPKLKNSVSPVYPLEARRSSVQGDVILDTLITEKGKVTDIKVVSGPPLLRQAAISAVSLWTYEPAKLNGQPVPMRLSVTIKFVR
jgi:TonB family protein